MESSQLKVEKRNKLYFDKFTYKAILHIPGAQYTYYTYDLESYVNRLSKIKANRLYWNKSEIDNDSYEINLDKISQFMTWRNTIDKKKCSIRTQGDKVSFFSNDLELLKTLKCITADIRFYQAECLEKDKLYFKKEPKYKFRTYFRGKRMPKDFSENIRTLQGIYSTIHFSEGLFRSLFHNNWHPYRYMHGSYFVEYNDEQMLTILSMWFPDMLAKTYNCVKEP